MTRWMAAGLAGLLVGGCSQPLEVTDSASIDSDNDSDTDDDTDSDPDTDDDSDSGTLDTGPTFCDESLSSPTPGSSGLGECVTEELQCGDSIEASNEGGSFHYDKDMYESWHCASTESSTAHYNGAERSYFFVQPPNTIATVTLEKECERHLEMRIIRKSESDMCPGASNNLVFCERDAAAGAWDDQDVKLTTVSNGLYYEIIVDGRNDATANFRLSIDCES